MWCIQYVQNASCVEECRETLDGLALQDGFLGGRFLPPCGQIDKDTWRIQAFFEAGAEIDNVFHPDAHLPDGMRYVFVPTFLRKTLGFK